MDITVVGRNAEISSRLRDYVEEKAAKVEQLDPRVQRVEVEVTHERNPRQARRWRCELLGKHSWLEPLDSFQS
ncbi:MAG: HPF/RaiA family ribosome-associated protein, partial [Actinomyces massiliensis]